MGFYLTYEELKHANKNNTEYLQERFYLTYEELKLVVKDTEKGGIHDFILPMRNWNPFMKLNPGDNLIRFYLTYEELKLATDQQRGITDAWILSYLWGIET